MNELRTEKYKTNVFLFFIYVCSPLVWMIIIFNLGNGNELLNYLLIILLVVDFLWFIFVCFCNIKIKRVLFHKIEIFDDYLISYDYFPKVGVKIKSKELIIYNEIEKVESGKKAYGRKRNKVLKFPFHFLSSDLRDNRLNVCNYFVVRYKNGKETLIRYFNCYSNENKKLIIDKIGIEKCPEWDYLYKDISKK